jgi:hypothetical protein
MFPQCRLLTSHILDVLAAGEFNAVPWTDPVSIPQPEDVKNGKMSDEVKDGKMSDEVKDSKMSDEVKDGKTIAKSEKRAKLSQRLRNGQ